MRVSVFIPSKGCKHLNYALFSLREQIVRPDEVILVIKDCDVKEVAKSCSAYNLSCVIVEQDRGYITRAMNIGMRQVQGDVVLVTDDDAIAPRGWIKRYIGAFRRAHREIACISGRDVYIKLDGFKIIPTIDDYPHTKLFRWFVRTWLDSPLEILKEYRFGVYISDTLEIIHGPYIPEKACLSLPYRGVNMGFRGEVADIVEVPEHPELRRAIGYEQYVGLRLVLNGFNSIYIPDNPILHIHREESLSRTRDKSVMKEVAIMKLLFLSLLSRYSVSFKNESAR